MIEKIKKALNNYKDISGWTLTRENLTRDELYLIGRERECRRAGTSIKYLVNIYTENQTPEGKRLGFSQFHLQPGNEEISDKLELAISQARRVNNPVWSLPAKGQTFLELNLCDASTVSNPENALAELEDQLQKSLAHYPGTFLSSSEIFIVHCQHELYNSQGLELTDQLSEISMEYILLGGADKEAETRNYLQSRFVADLDLVPSLERHIQYVQDNARAELPPSGIFDVLLTEEALDTFFNYFLFHTSGAAKFNKLSQLKHSEPVIKDIKGEKLTLSSDPGVITTKSRTYDPDGLALKKLDIIKENLFLHHHSSKKYADYIGLNHPTPLSTVCIESGATHYDDFKKNRPVVELAKFSTFAPNETTGNFSGEIRQGTFYGKERVFPIKGGSISGKIQQAFQEIYFSYEKVLRTGYFGPKGLLVRGVTISGK